ncbi:MAG: DNA polymerase III subunit alpha, partial [Dysgonamonadaceae bacterium]|nr:DNA polymerase III subunit alpha [Dysgonamonadaceae bacterium]
DNFQEVQREHFFTDNGKGEAFIETLIRYGNKYQSDKNSAMNSLFGGFDSVDISKPEIPKIEPWSNIERLNKEKELVGIYLSSHPLDDHYIALNYVCTLNMKDFETAKTSRIQQELTLGGIVASYREGYTRNNTQYGVLKMEDFTGSAEIPLFGKDFIEYSKYGRPNMYLMIKGMFTPNPYNPSNISFRVSSIYPLNEIRDYLVEKITISLPLHRLDDRMIADLSSLIQKNPGHTALYFKIEDAERQLSIALASDKGRYAIDKSIVQYLEEHQFVFEINK